MHHLIPFEPNKLINLEIEGNLMGPRIALIEATDNIKEKPQFVL
jgi:hypothetical protein